ncbi:MAG: peptide chain release factor N(5)-glutamine methyltransferase [Pseudomonadales bacterium]
MNIKALLAELRNALTVAACTSAQLDAELLLAHARGVPRGWLYAHGDAMVDNALLHAARELVARRAAGEPLAYIVGHREFWSMALQVDARVLVPRPETECMVEAVLALDLPAQGIFVDAGTGSAAIALALASGLPGWRGVALDYDQAALQVCRANIRRLGREACLLSLRGDWLACFAAQSLNLVVANPPYIAARDPHLDARELRFEPARALASGPDGLDALRMISSQAPACLVKGGYLAVEHGFKQQPAVVRLMESNGLRVVQRGNDLAGQPRYVLAVK